MAKELLFSLTKKDFDIQTFPSGGPGGQHQNKTSSGVRIIHRDSGATGESRTERSQLQNKKLALERLVKSTKFQMWHKKKVWEIINKKTVEQKVIEDTQPDKLKVEVRDDQGKWVEVKDDLLKENDNER